MSPRENSVKQLCEFYNVVTGVALAYAITKLIDASAQYIPLKTGHIFLFLAFVATIIPFHQGAVRHLYATYVEHGGSSRIKNGALALDFIILFAEACLFVALAALIENGPAFANAMMVLLIVDCIWGFLSHLAFTGAQAQNAERKWSIINVVATAVVFVLIVFVPPILGSWGVEAEQCLFAVCLARSIADYVWAWSFYYPDPPLT
jgi:hypothetical protein